MTKGVAFQYARRKHRKVLLAPYLVQAGAEDAGANLGLGRLGSCLGP